MSDENFTLLNLNISEASWPISINFMCIIIGVGESLYKVLGQIDLGTLDSGERSLPFGLLLQLPRVIKLVVVAKILQEALLGILTLPTSFIT